MAYVTVRGKDSDRRMSYRDEIWIRVNENKATLVCEERCEADRKGLEEDRELGEKGEHTKVGKKQYQKPTRNKAERNEPQRGEVIEKIEEINKAKERCERRVECVKNQVTMLKQEIEKYQENSETEKEQYGKQKESNNGGHIVLGGNESKNRKVNYADENGNITPGKIRIERSTASIDKPRKLEGKDLEDEMKRREENKGKFLSEE